MRKRKLFTAILTFVFSVILFIKCTQNEFLERNYPVIETLEVNNISDKGVTFNAEINNSSNYDITEHGFVWGTRTMPDINNYDKKTISSKIISGKFSANITTTLVVDKIYYVRAYLKTSKYIVYGNQTLFRSFGSSAAIIKRLEPNNGVWRDTIN
jgi:hypothetical protein